jgi:hypothetical protein
MADAEDLTDLLGPEPAPVQEAPDPELEAPSVPMLTPGRAAFRRSRSITLKPRKLSNERMLRVINAISEMPVASDACMRAGMSVTTLKYWLTKSAEGRPGDGYDVVFDPDEPEATRRFHEAWNDAMEIGIGRVESATIQRALGYLEPLTYQGRVIYKHDPELVALFGYECQQTYLLDPATGEPVPETLFKQDPDLQMFILKTRKAEVYGNKQSIDVNHRGGVLVVSAVAKSSQALLEQGKDYKADAVDVEFSEVSDPTS